MGRGDSNLLRRLGAALGALGMLWAGALHAQHADQLGPEMRRALIVGIQEELNDHGYGAGPVDGVYGQRTRTAIREYQKDAGLTPNGEPTKDLLDHLKFAKPSVYRSRIASPAPARAAPSRTAARSDLALSVQRELKVRGYYGGALDGVAGPQTQAAIRGFQRDAGLPVTGILDERLLGELRAVDPKITAGGRSG